MSSSSSSTPVLVWLVWLVLAILLSSSRVVLKVEGVDTGLPLGTGGSFPYSVIPGTTSASTHGFVNSAGTTVASIDGTGNLVVTQPGALWTNNEYNPSAISVKGAQTGNNTMLYMGADSTNSVGYIQVVNAGCCQKTLYLNKRGGAVNTIFNTLDDGTGNMNVAGLLTPTGGINLGWTAFTTTAKGSTTNPTYGTTAVSSSYYMVMGKMLFLTYQVYWSTSAGTAGAGNYYFNLPTGFTINTAVATAGNGAGSNAIGSSYWGASGSVSATGTALVYGSNAYVVQSNGYYWGGGVFTFASASLFSCSVNLQIPIL